MRRRVVWPLLLAIPLLALSACSGKTVTQIVVSIATDMIIPDELDLLRFQAGYDQVNDAVEIEWELDRNKVGFIELPATIGLVPGPKNGKLPVLLTARAVRGGKQAVVRQARVPFAEGRILLLKLNLLRRCIGVKCSADQSCGELGCEKIDKNPDDLPSYSGDAAFAGTGDLKTERRDLPTDRRDAAADGDSKTDFPIERFDGGDGGDGGDGPPRDSGVDSDGQRPDTTRDAAQPDTTRDGAQPDTTGDAQQDISVDGPPGDSTFDAPADTTIDLPRDSTVDLPGDSSIDLTLSDVTIDLGSNDVGSADTSVDTTVDVGGLDGPLPIDGAPEIAGLDPFTFAPPPRAPVDNRIAEITLDGPRRALIERVAPWRALPISRSASPAR